MSDELRLPDELAACEARLAARRLTPPALNREELLYRAGWAACEAAMQSRRGASQRMAVTGRRRLVAWSTASAALAATLAVVATRALQPGPSPVAAAPPPIVRQSIASEAVVTRPPATAFVDANRRLLARLDAVAAGQPNANFGASSGALLAALSDRRSTRWDEPIFVSTAALGNEIAPREPATARQMLEEYLPGDARRAAPVGSADRGGVLELWNPSDEDAI